MGTWNHADIPSGAGFCVLAIDGAGGRGIIAAQLLKQIEAQLGIPIHQLFDLIIGTGTGGTTALAYGKSRLPGQKVVEFFRDLQENGFDPAFFPIFNANYRFLRPAARRVLGRLFSNQPMLGSGQLPRVAVVACEPSAKKKIVLLTSYQVLLYNTSIPRATDGTVIEAAEATTCSGIHFPIYVTPYGKFVDGGYACNNPCSLGYEEAKLLWPEMPLDYLLNIGAGGSYNTTGASRSLASQMVNSHIAYEQLHSLHVTPHTVSRLNMSVGQDHNIDDIENAAELLSQVSDYIKNHKPELTLISNILLAKIFYITPTPDDKCSFTIRARVPVPQLNGVDVLNVFSAKILVGDDNERNIIPVPTHDGILQIEVPELAVQDNIELHVKSHLSYDGKFVREGFLIGGCPRKINTTTSKSLVDSQ